MKKFIFIIFLGLFITSCHHTKDSAGTVKANKTSAGAEGTGTSFTDAIIVDENTETAGVAAEYKWLKANYPGYSLISQSLVYNEGKPYDVMDIKTASGEEKKIYFDISNFFGKF
jgi:hypothetical protein